jgi:hypothetical protein
MQPLARMMWRTLLTSLGRKKVSTQKRCSHKSQWGSIP